MKKLVLTPLLLLLLVAGVSAQTPVTPQERAIVNAWHELGASIDKENGLLTELTLSLRLSPPWRVVDAREPGKRAKLIDEVIAEHRKRIKLLEKIKEQDNATNR